MNISILVKIILIVLFMGCLIDWPYGYYQMVRFVGMVGFSILAYHDYKNNKTWFYIWLISAVLINPFFKIALGRNLWNLVDVIWAMTLAASMFIKRIT